MANLQQLLVIFKCKFDSFNINLEMSIIMTVKPRSQLHVFFKARTRYNLTIISGVSIT